MWSSSYGRPLSFQKVLETNVLKENLRIATRFPWGWNNGPMLAPGLAHWWGAGWERSEGTIESGKRFTLRMKSSRCASICFLNEKGSARADIQIRKNRCWWNRGSKNS